MNDNALQSPMQPAAATPNYGTLIWDHSLRLHYITDHASGRRLYRYPACRICGMSPWWFSPHKPRENACGLCSPERREANDADF